MMVYPVALVEKTIKQQIHLFINFDARRKVTYKHRNTEGEEGKLGCTTSRVERLSA
jgi:hypothetical protein